MIGPTAWIGVAKTSYPISPPSEPYVRFSRIRLASRWFTAPRIDVDDLGCFHAELYRSRFLETGQCRTSCRESGDGAHLVRASRK